jgi:hypothetical protein
MSADAPDHQTPLPDPPSNGILGRLPSQYVAAASKTLPDPKATPGDLIQAEVDTGDWGGRVRLSFKKQQVRRSKPRSSLVFWTCFHAERVA